MAKVHLVGVQALDFVNKDGQPVKGLNLQVIFPDDRVYGMRADTKFISDIVASNLGLTPDSLKPFFDRDIYLDVNLNGKVIGISPAED